MRGVAGISEVTGTHEAIQIMEWLLDRFTWINGRGFQTYCIVDSSRPEQWQEVSGSILSEPSGIQFGTLEWCVEERRGDVWECIIPPKWFGGISLESRIANSATARRLKLTRLIHSHLELKQA